MKCDAIFLIIIVLHGIAESMNTCTPIAIWAALNTNILFQNVKYQKIFRLR